MILTNRFVFVHMPKTGGSFVRRIFRRTAPPEWEFAEIDSHVFAADTPESHAHLPKVGFVRNPFDWYLSFYRYLIRKPPKPAHFFMRISEGGTLPFQETIKNYFALPYVKRSGKGAMTHFLELHFGPGLGALEQVGKCETLRDDLEAVVVRYFGSLPEAMRDEIRSAPKVNVDSGAETPASAYSEELRDMVWKGDREICDRFGYEKLQL